MIFSSDLALCHDIVTELNDPQRKWFLPFRAGLAIKHEWSAKSGELDELRVLVGPGFNADGELRERDDSEDVDDPVPHNQSGVWSTWPINLTICQRLQKQSEEELFELLHVAEQIRRFLVPQQFALPDGRRFVSTEYEYLARFDPTLLSRVESKSKISYTGTFLSAIQIPFQELT